MSPDDPTDPSWPQTAGHGAKLPRKQEQAIACLLAQPSIGEAARAAGVGERTLRRWLQDPGFLAAYRRARQEVVEGTIGRIQAATGTAVDTLLAVTREGKRDGDRVRAAVALLDHARRGLAEADALQGARDLGAGAPMDTAEVVRLLGARLRQVDASDLPTVEKSRLTATLADALLRALGMDVIAQRLEALQAVLIAREENRDERKRRRQAL